MEHTDLSRQVRAEVLMREKETLGSSRNPCLDCTQLLFTFTHTALRQAELPPNDFIAAMISSGTSVRKAFKGRELSQFLFLRRANLVLQNRRGAGSVSSLGFWFAGSTVCSHQMCDIFTCLSCCGSVNSRMLCWVIKQWESCLCVLRC